MIDIFDKAITPCRASRPPSPPTGETGADSRAPAVAFDVADVDPLTGPEEAGGVEWSLSGSELNANLVVLPGGGGIGEHRNDSVDVLVVTMAGSGTVTCDEHCFDLHLGVVVHLPRGTLRRIDAGSGGLRYLTVHRRRGGLEIGGTPAGRGRPVQR